MEKQGNHHVDRINVFIRTRTDKKGKIDFEAQEAIVCSHFFFLITNFKIKSKYW